MQDSHNLFARMLQEDIRNLLRAKFHQVVQIKKEAVGGTCDTQTTNQKCIENVIVGRDVSVGIASRYGWGGLGNESRWG